MDTPDIELEYARQLGDILREMRRDLTDKAANAPLMWSLERYGIHVSTTLIFDRYPDPRQVAIKNERYPDPRFVPIHAAATSDSIASPAPLSAPAINHNGETQPSAPPAIRTVQSSDFQCPSCPKICQNRAGLKAHLRFAHRSNLVSSELEDQS